jgi:chromosome partitioning protein
MSPYNVAIEASHEIGTLLADMDPQQSLADLWRRRGELLNPRLIENVRSVGEAVRRLEEAGYARDVMFVDTPGSDIGVIRDALITADAIVLPVQPSPMDLLAQEAACNLVAELDKGDVTLFVLNRIDGRSNLGRESLA